MGFRVQGLAVTRVQVLCQVGDPTGGFEDRVWG